MFIPRHKEVLKPLEVNIQLQLDLFKKNNKTGSIHTEFGSLTTSAYIVVLIQEIMILHNVIETGNAILTGLSVNTC